MECSLHVSLLNMRDQERLGCETRVNTRVYWCGDKPRSGNHVRIGSIETVKEWKVWLGQKRTKLYQRRRQNHRLDQAFYAKSSTPRRSETPPPIAAKLLMALPPKKQRISLFNVKRSHFCCKVTQSQSGEGPNQMGLT